MKFSWLSNSVWSSSGYGQTSLRVVPRLAAAGHEIGVICYYGLEGGVISMGPGITCFPKRFHPYGNDIAVPHTAAHNSRFMLSLMDTWVMNPEDYPYGFKWLAWWPCDHDPISPAVRGKIAQAWRRVSMSRHGVRMANEAGLDSDYIPLVVDTKIMQRRDQMEARRAIGLPEDKFIIGTVAMNKGNPSRKNFDQMMHAFAEFHSLHPESFYFLQTDKGEGVPDTVNLPELGRALGLIEGQDYGFCNQYQNAIGFPPEYFPGLYSALDVHLLASAGEGFGLPTAEAQACGTPVIVGDWTASSELFHSGQLIPRQEAEPFWTSLASYQFHPRVGAIVDALEQEYRHPTDAGAAVEFIRREYDADVVVRDRWLPMLADIERELDASQAEMATPATAAVTA